MKQNIYNGFLATLCVILFAMVVYGISLLPADMVWMTIVGFSLVIVWRSLFEIIRSFRKNK